MPDPPLFAADFFMTCVSGWDKLSSEARTCLREAVATSQATNGLFKGLDGRGDLYYTFFGLLLAAVTNAKIKLSECEHALSDIDFNSLDLVHSCVWLRVDNLLKLLTLPTFLRRNVAEYLSPKANKQTIEKLHHLSNLAPNAFPQSDPSAPYSRFLLSTLHADFGLNFPEIDLSPYRLSSGLYANLRQKCPQAEEKGENQIEYGVNATASALFVIPESERRTTVEALCRLQQEDGSFKACENAPDGDMLSTGTAIFALNKFGTPPWKTTKPFLRCCFRDDGLFAATPEASQGDLEYTVYALLALGGVT